MTCDDLYNGFDDDTYCGGTSCLYNLTHVHYYYLGIMPGDALRTTGGSRSQHYC